MKFQRLIIRCAEEVYARRGAGVAEGLPETVRPQPAERQGVDIGQPRAVAAEAVAGIVKVEHAAIGAGKQTGGERAAQLAGGQGAVEVFSGDGIGSGGELLKRRQGGVAAN